jgi:microsomal dipeptidase-like Zn-dependent dipeptidase
MGLALSCSGQVALLHALDGTDGVLRRFSTRPTARHAGQSAGGVGGGGVDGMKDIVDLPKVTAALVEAGYSEEDIAKIWGGNVLRLMSEVEAARSSDLSSPQVLN